MRQIREVLLRSFNLFGLALLAAGCGVNARAPGTEISFASSPLATVTSRSGQLRIEVRWSPAVPVKGDNAVELSFVDERGVPPEGLEATVVPWMPAHAHGTSIQPTSTQTGPGVFVASPLYLYMAGQWQLRMMVSGSFDDSAVADVQIP